MKTITIVKMAFVASWMALGACAAEESLEAEERGGLMFGLEPEDVDQIHAEYLADEDIGFTEAQLTAPFDCSLYGDLCDLAGPTGAKMLTGEVVDMALEGAPAEEIDELIDVRLDEIMEDYDAINGPNQLRAAGFWRYSGTGRAGAPRVRIRSGIFTPAIGQRRAWTRIEAQERVGVGLWESTSADTLCLDVGTNTQTQIDRLGANAPDEWEFETFDPLAFCFSNVAALSSRTFHARNTGGTSPATPHLPPFTRDYEISSQGSGSGTFGTQTFSVTSLGRVEQF